MTPSLPDLVKRLEAATGADRRLNCDIGAALGEQFQRAFTSSLDAAQTLVPDDLLWCVGTSLDHDEGLINWANVRLPDMPDRRFDVSIHAATPALALCAAALRARAHLEEAG